MRDEAATDKLGGVKAIDGFKVSGDSVMCGVCGSQELYQGTLPLTGRSESCAWQCMQARGIHRTGHWFIAAFVCASLRL